MKESTLRDALAAAATAAGLQLPEATLLACERHHTLLLKWNKTHNLTRVVEAGAAASRHYLDGLLPALRLGLPQHAGSAALTVADIGSGAGFPGLMLALAWPAAQIALVEPAQKRASFLRLAIAELGLGGRVSVAAPPAQPAALVVSRATFSEGQRSPLAQAVAPHGQLWLWSVPAEQGSFSAEMAGLGLVPMEPLAYGLAGAEGRVVLRAQRG